jgi:hypothetical protein
MMPKIKTQSTARQEYRCDFCKGKIDRGSVYVKSHVKDRFGRYNVRHHEDCDRTAELNEIAGREW